MRNVLTFICTMSFLVSFAQQHPTCDDQRYIDDVFTELDSTFNIQYGEGVTIGGANQELFFDVFEPSGDTAEKRPVIVLAFGGSYISGVKEDMHWICKRYARKGFVAVSIDYRLYDLSLLPLPTDAEMQVVVTKSLTDMKGAIRYLRADADGNNDFKIDPNLIFVGGISAGAITACHTAYLDEDDTLSETLSGIIEAEGGLEGTVNDLAYPSNVQGVVNFSGGLNDALWVDSNDPPITSVHESGDPTVPYNGGFASIFGLDIIFMEGSGRLKEVADQVGVLNSLTTIDEESHVGYFFDEQQTDELINASSFFLQEIICDESMSNTEEALNTINNVNIYPNPSSDKLFIESTTNGNPQIRLMQINGRLLDQWTGSKVIDVSNYQSGMYLIEILDPSNAERKIEKVIFN